MTFPGDSRRALLGIIPLAIDGPAVVRVRRPNLSPCNLCGGCAFAEIDASTSGGFGCGTVYDCAPMCGRIVCPHGVRWDAIDTQCDACERASRDADAENGDDS